MKKTLLALVAILCFTFAASAADISGKWVRDPSAAPAGGGGGGGRGGGGTYEFKVSGSTLSGTVTTPGRGGGDPTVVTIEKGKVDGNTFTFSITRPGRGGGDPTTTVYNGKIETARSTATNWFCPSTWVAERRNRFSLKLRRFQTC
jgi:opacity protein-like surface antigen